MKRKRWFSALLTVVIVLGAAGLAVMPAQARDPKEREEEPPVPYSLTLAPVTDENPVGSIHTVVATVRCRDRERMEGVDVSFVVRGPCGVITTPRPVPTNRRGEAEFSWTRTCEGTDTIVAFAGGLTARATKRWFVPAPTVVMVSPESVVVGETASLLIRGTNFTPEVRIWLALDTEAVTRRIEATDVQILHPTLLAAIISIPGDVALGPWTAVVAIPGGEPGMLAHGVRLQAEPLGFVWDPDVNHGERPVCVTFSIYFPPGSVGTHGVKVCHPDAVTAVRVPGGGPGGRDRIDIHPRLATASFLVTVTYGDRDQIRKVRHYGTTPTL